MDLRLPAGLFFSALGLILCLMGLVSSANNAPLTEANVNLYSGVVMLIFGGVMLWAASRRKA